MSSIRRSRAAFLLQALIGSEPLDSEPGLVAVIEPAARGLFEIAKADLDESFVGIGNIEATSPFPHHAALKLGPMIALRNCPVLTAGCQMSPLIEVFGPRGKLGLKAVTLSFDKIVLGAFQLGVVLEPRTSPGRPLVEGSFTVISVEPNAKVQVNTLVPERPDSKYLERIFGLERGPASPPMYITGDDLDEIVGFPGACDYLTIWLPQLGEYLGMVASALKARS